MKEKILYAVCFILCIVWLVVTLVYDFLNPIRVEDLSVEERIRYEQMIFP